MASSDDLTTRRDKYIAGLRIRTIACASFVLVFAATAALYPAHAPDFIAPIIILLCLPLLNFPFWILGRRRSFPLSDFYGHWIADLFMVTLVLHALGGIDLPLGACGYMIMILTSAVLLSERAAFFVATCSLLCFDGLVAAEQFGILPHRVHIWTHQYTAGAKVVIILGANSFFFLFALLAGTLSEQLRKANAALAQARDDLKRYSVHLEQAVNERTRELDQKRRDLESLVHIATHDLKNVSVGAAELARRLSETEEQGLSARGRRYARNLVGDLRAMNEMLAHLLAFFKVGSQELHAETVDMNELIQGVVGPLLERAREKGIQIEVKELPTVSVDSLQMHHVLTNLLDNAIKYSGDKIPSWVRIDCSCSDNEDVFTIADNGIGIPSGQIEKIFQLYYRGFDEQGRPHSAVGHGVGLAITKRIIEQWGGRIDVSSVVGSGTVFSFSCPRRGNDGSSQLDTPQDGGRRQSA